MRCQPYGFRFLAAGGNNEGEQGESLKVKTVTRNLTLFFRCLLLLIVTSCVSQPVLISQPPQILSTAITTPSNLPVNFSNTAQVSMNPSMNGNRKPAMTREQLKYCTAIIKQLKRHRDAPAFLNPVDPVLLNIPDYPKVVKVPMDLSTVERKLNGLEFDTVDHFVRDVNLIFTNCFLYNGRESPVSICASNLEAAFHSSLRHMPRDVRHCCLWMSAV